MSFITERKFCSFSRFMEINSLIDILGATDIKMILWPTQDINKEHKNVLILKVVDFELVQ